MTIRLLTFYMHCIELRDVDQSGCVSFFAPMWRGLYCMKIVCVGWPGQQAQAASVFMQCCTAQAGIEQILWQ